MYKVNLKIFEHVAQGTLFGGCLEPQFFTHFSIIKTEKMKDQHSDRYSSFVEQPKAADHAVAQGTRFCTLTYFFMYNYLQQLFYR